MSFLQFKMRTVRTQIELQIDGEIRRSDRELYKLTNNLGNFRIFNSGDEDSPGWQNKIYEYVNHIQEGMNLPLDSWEILEFETYYRNFKRYFDISILFKEGISLPAF